MGQAKLKGFEALLAHKDKFQSPGALDAAMVNDGPAKAFADTAAEETAFTPDMPLLTTREYHSVFVYDALKNNHPDHEVIGEDAVFFGEAFTNEARYVMYVDQKGSESYPFILSRPFKPGICAPIKGEVYTVPTHRMISLDEYYTNTLIFKRVRMTVHRPIVERDKEGNKTRVYSTPIKVWAYIGDQRHFNPRLKSSSNMRLHHLNNSSKDFNPYYLFSVADYNK